MSTEALLLAALAWVVYPLWLLAGAADFACHRATDIEHTAGLAESRWHLIQLALVGAPIVIALLFEVTTLVLAFALACLLLHTLAAYADTRVTTPRRAIPPFEQHVHAVLDSAPAVAFGIGAILHWPRFAALFGAGSADWSLRLRDPPLPASVITAVLGAALLLAVLPGLWEWHRCARAEGRAR